MLRLALALAVTAASLPAATAQPVEDEEFGDAGFATVPLAFSAFNVTSALANDGSLVVGGKTNDGIPGVSYLARLREDGTPDIGFGDNGVVTFGSLGLNEAPIVTGLAVRPDGGVWAAGSVYIPSDGLAKSRAFVASFGSDGSPDATFGEGGFVIVDATPDAGFVHVSGLVHACDALYLYGDAIEGALPANTGFAARVTLDGDHDLDFGVDGAVLTGPNSQVNDVAVRPDCRVVAVGRGVDASDGVADTDALILGLDAAGRPDPAFESRTFDLFGGEYNDAVGVTLLDDGRALVSGVGVKDSGDSQARGAVLLLIGTDGVLDEGFGSGGWVWTDLFAGGGERELVGRAAETATGFALPALHRGRAGVHVLSVLSDGSPDTDAGPAGVTSLFEDREPLYDGWWSVENGATARLAPGALVVSGVEVKTVSAPFIARVSLSESTAAGTETFIGEELGVAPNPVAGTAHVRISLAAPRHVSLAVYDALGRRVVTLRNGPAPAGELRATWDASAAAPGIYLVRARVGSTVSTCTLTVTR